ncbi:MAG: isochorismatase family protein, partial [Lacipirellulaceae bacterium]
DSPRSTSPSHAVDHQTRSDSPRRSPLLMNAAEAALLVIDVQPRLVAAQPEASRVLWNCRRLIDGARATGVALAVTEQSPDKLGPTDPALAERLPAPIAKTAFSAAACERLFDAWREGGVRHVVLVGFETHVCVAQTAIDLLAEGFEPQVVADAVASRSEHDHRVALRRLESLGVVVTTTEAALFEWVADATHPAFRAVSALAKETPPA